MFLFFHHGVRFLALVLLSKTWHPTGIHRIGWQGHL